MIAPPIKRSPGRNHKKSLKLPVAWGLSLLALIAVVAVIAVRHASPTVGDKEPAQRGRSAEAAPPSLAKADEKRKFAVRTRDVAVALENVGEFEKPEVVKSTAPIHIDIYTNRYFKTGVEQVMGWVFTCKLGDMPPPLPTFSEEDRMNLAAILISKNEIKDGDDEKAAETKEMVDFAKREMMAFIKEGGDPQQFMEYYHAELRKANEYRTLAVAQAEEIYGDDPEMAQKFIDKINETLDEKGIRPISVSDFE